MNLKRLLYILGLNRADDGPGILEFYNKVLKPYSPSPMLGSGGEHLAWTIVTDPSSKTLFSAHCDTAESWDGQLRRKVKVDKDNIVHSDGTHVLGADDGAGIVLLLEMIDAGVPGTFSFTRGEELGGKGSRQIAQEHSAWLSTFDRCISFDRKGTTSIITNQFACGRCCSNDFGRALGDALGGEGRRFLLDPTGSFTDNANYTDFIAEVVNISCGYEKEHTAKETLDLNFLEYMAAKVITLDWEGLPKVRKPGERDTVFPGGNKMSKKRVSMAYPAEWRDLRDMSFLDIMAWLKKAPARDVAGILFEMHDLLLDKEEEEELYYAECSSAQISEGSSDGIWSGLK